MVKNHLKRINMPRTWPIKRKGIKFVTRPNPGKHKLHDALSLQLVLTDLLSLANNRKEVRTILFNNDVLVDNKKVKDNKYNVGLMDIISFPLLKESYRILFTRKGKLSVLKIDVKETLKPCKIIGKRLVKNDKLQLNLNDGRNYLVDKKEKDKYKVGDTLLIDLNDNKILKVLPLKEKMFVYLIGGKHIGKFGIIESFEEDRFKFKDLEEDSVYETSKDYALIIGEKAPEITIKNN